MHFKLSIIKTNFIKFKELSKLMGSTEIIKFKQKRIQENIKMVLLYKSKTRKKCIFTKIYKNY